MRNLVFLALLAGPAAAAGPGFPFDPSQGAARLLDDRLIGRAASDPSIVSNLTELSDEIGPRLTGSKGLEKACHWAAAKLKSYGVEDVRLEPWTIPEGWQRGHARLRLVEPDNGVPITAASYGWRPGTNGKVTGDVVAIRAPSMKELEKLKGKLKGAVVLLGPPSPVRALPGMNETPPARPSIITPRPSFAEMMAFQKQRDAFLAKEGAAALLIDGAKPFNLVPTTGGWPAGDRASASNRIPQLFVGHDHYAMLHRLATRKGKATRLELDVANTFIPGPIKVYNVVGEIRGKDRPDEIVVVGAHIDSWDLAQGTTDNGTGTCTVLEVARLLAKSGTRPSRTIRFCLFSGEEQGLLGSKAYVEKHKAEMAKTSCALIHDVGTGRVLGLGVGHRPAIAALLKQELESLRPLGVRDFRSRSMGGSDHSSFERAGVPGFLMTQEASLYFVSHHTAADTVERINERDLVQGATAIAVTAMRVANLETLLPRTKGKP